MKEFTSPPIISLGVIALAFASCAPTQVPNAAAAPVANSYGVPQATTSAQGAYPTTSSTVYPVTTTTAPVVTPSDPVYSSTTAPSSSGQSYTVQKGDTLWGISRKYNTSVGAIQSANGISGSNILAGQTLQIP